MARRALLSCAGAGALLALGPAAAVSAASKRCEPKGSKTVLRGSQARVYVLDRRYYGCVYSYGKARYVRNGPPFETTRLNGRFLLYTMPTAYDEGAGLVPAHGFVVDLRPPGTRGVPGRGHVHNFDTPGPGPTVDGEPANARNRVNPVTDAIVSAGGSGAWISKPPPAGGDYRVFKVDRHGTDAPVELVAAGPDIAPTSLRVSATTLTWRQGGATRTARLHH